MCLVSIAKPAGVDWPTVSLVTSKVKMMLPSGVICGNTSSFRLALRKAIEVAPLDRRYLIRQLSTLLNQRFDLVGCHYTGTGHHFTLAIGLQCRNFQSSESDQHPAPKIDTAKVPGLLEPSAPVDGKFTKLPEVVAAEPTT